MSSTEVKRRCGRGGTIPRVRWAVVFLGVSLGCWLTFDGVRALTLGDYVTPRSGPYAGRLGPWSQLVWALGIDPRSAVVKWAHVALGVLWLAASAGFAARVASWSSWCVLACAVASLWYVPMGTLIS